MSDVPLPPAPGGNEKRPSVRTLPDETICRAKWTGFGDYADCLVTSPGRCEHALQFGNGYLCIHPKRKDIVEKSAPRPRPSAT